MDLPASTTAGARRVYCVYPVSGNYTSYQRNLLYLATAFALLGHAHEWLTAGTLAFIAAYSSTAAVHGMALAFDGGGQHDGDLFAAGVVVRWALYTSFACAVFFPRLRDRHFGLLACWSFLLVVSNFVQAFALPRLVRDMDGSIVLSVRDGGGRWSDPCAEMNVRTFFRGYPGDSMSPVVWDNGIGSADVSSSLLYDADGEIIPKPDVYQAGGGVLWMVMNALKSSLLLAPSIQMLSADRRTARNHVFVRLLAKRVLYPLSRRKVFHSFVVMRFLQLHWLLLKCLPVLVVVDLPLKVAARRLFRLLDIPRLNLEDISFLEPQTISQRRYQAAKYAAMSFHLLTYLGYVTWLPDVALNAKGGAGPLAHIPESETFRAVGQWSSWLTFSLATAPAFSNASFRLLGWYPPDKSGPDSGQIDTMNPWWQHHPLRNLYSQFRESLFTEWSEMKEWSRHPENHAIASLRAAEQDDDTDDRFASRMIQALEVFSRDQIGFILPLSMPRAAY